MEKDTRSTYRKFAGILLILVLMIVVLVTFKSSQLSNHQRTNAQSADITPNPTSPLQLKGLDSTIRANWPAPTASYSKQIFSVWDGNTIVSTKVLGNTATVADANGLQGDHQYTIRIEGIRTSDGQKELYLTNSQSTRLQPPITNAAFFENFMDTSPMEVKSDYLDVRNLANDGNQPDTLHEERMMFMPNEKHFHTEMLGGTQRSELTVRPRVPFDFTNRVGTFQTEVDMAPVQNQNQGVWWEIHLTKEIPGSGRALGSGGGQEFQHGITFSIAKPENTTGTQGIITNVNMNRPLITVNTTQSNPADAYTVEGTLRQATGVNVRMPVVLKIIDDPTGHPGTPNKAQMYINGVLVDETVWMNFGFTKGFWTLAHRHFYTSRNNDFQIPNQLVHWDTIQYDGPSGSTSPFMRTYIQPNCTNVVNYDIHSYQNGGIRHCAQLNFVSNHATVPVNISQQDMQTGGSIRGGRLIFSVTRGQAASYSGDINGVAFTQPYFDNSEYEPDPATVLIRHDLTSAEIATLHQGGNTITFNGNNNITVTQVELEVEFTQSRAIGNPPTTNPPVMLSATSNNFRIHHDPANPNNTETVSTTLFSSGAAGAVSWHADLYMDSNDHDIDGNTVNDWLRISSANGTLSDSPAHAATLDSTVLTPLTITADFSRLRTDCNSPTCIAARGQDDGNDGTVGVIRLTTTDDPTMMYHMPVYIAVMVVNDGQTAAHDKDDQLLTTFTGLNGTFNECAIPNYCSSPNDTPTPTRPPAASPTPTVIPTPTFTAVCAQAASITAPTNQVTVSDLNSIGSNIGLSCTGCNQDLNHDGRVTIQDSNLARNCLSIYNPVPTRTPTPARFRGGANIGSGSASQPSTSSDGSATYTIDKNNGVLNYPASQ